MTLVRSIAAVAALCLSLSSAPALATPVTIDFGGSPFGTLTGTTTEDGFNYDNFSGIITVTSPGNPAPDLSTTAGTPISILRIVSSTAGEKFDFLELDLAEFKIGGGAGTTDITAEGFLLGASQGSETYTPSSSGGGLGTYTTAAAAGALLGTLIDELRVTIRGAGSGFISITGRVDNIDLEVIPEPSTGLLFGTGMLGLLGYARRRKTLNA